MAQLTLLAGPVVAFYFGTRAIQGLRGVGEQVGEVTGTLQRGLDDTKGQVRDLTRQLDRVEDLLRKKGG